MSHEPIGMTDDELDAAMDQAIVVAPLKVGAILSAISAVQKDVCASGLAKTSRNEHFNFAFRGIDQVYNVFGPLFAKHGILSKPIFSDEREEKDGQQWRGKTHLKWHLVSAVDGSEFVAEGGGCATDSQGKSITKAQTCAIKYLTFFIFFPPLAPGAMDDADADSPQSLPAAPPRHPVEAPAPVTPPRIVTPPGKTDEMWEKVSVVDMKIEDKPAKNGKQAYSIYTLKFSNGKYGKCMGWKFQDLFPDTSNTTFYDVQVDHNPKYPKSFPDIKAAYRDNPMPEDVPS